MDFIFLSTAFQRIKVASKLCDGAVMCALERINMLACLH